MRSFYDIFINMNIILIDSEDYIKENFVILRGRRFHHVSRILGVKVGQELTIGEKQGLIGLGRVVKIEQDSVELRVSFSIKPPEPIDINMVVALPRPPMIRRILFTVASMGVKSLHFIHSRRVEKSFWQSSSLRPREMQLQLQLGLEQSGDTVFPDVIFHQKFKLFVQDELPKISKRTKNFFAHPCLNLLNGQMSLPATIIIGPEGGFIDYEVEQFKDQGFSPISLGPRILRVETAVIALIAKVL